MALRVAAGMRQWPQRNPEAGSSFTRSAQGSLLDDRDPPVVERRQVFKPKLLGLNSKVQVMSATGTRLAASDDDCLNVVRRPLLESEFPSCSTANEERDARDVV
jgi:hypothetical protein